MAELSTPELENFKNHVAIKFQLYNSLFISLPFHHIEKTGILLSLFLNTCEEGYAEGLSPSAIVEDFFKRFTELENARDKSDMLLRFIQYVERQIELFEALEESAYTEINDIMGVGTLTQLETKVRQAGVQEVFEKKLTEFNVA